MVSLADWRRLGELLFKRSATGDDMGVSGSFVVRGWMVRGQTGGADSFGGNSCCPVFVFSHETCEWQSQHRDETNSVCLASQRRKR